MYRSTSVGCRVVCGRTVLVELMHSALRLVLYNALIALGFDCCYHLTHLHCTMSSSFTGLWTTLDWSS